MREQLRERARTLVLQSSQSLRLWAMARVTLILAAARQRLDEQSSRVPPPARAFAQRLTQRLVTQRFGTQLWQRITTRFPALDEVLADLTNLDDRSTTAPFTPAPVTASVPTPSNATNLDDNNTSPPNASKNGTVTPVATQLRPKTVEPVQHVGDVPALLRALRDPSAEVAAAAATALSHVNDPAVVAQCHDALLEVLDNHEGYFNPLVRVSALQALVHELRGQASMAELSPLLRAIRDVDAEVSMAAIAAVAAHAPVDVVIDRLSPIVLDSTGFYLPIVRNAATRALERIGRLPSN